jgi:hypothetical protein
MLNEGRLEMKLRVIALCSMAAAACVADPTTGDTEQAVTPAQVQHGKDVWFKSTFGGEKFFSIILPARPRRRADVAA